MIFIPITSRPKKDMALFSDKKILKNHISDEIEVSYSQYGPTLAVSGILISPVRIVLVKNIIINLTKKKNNQQFLFEWLTLRPPRQQKEKIYTGIELRMPSKFMVTPSQSYMYHILFTDHNKYTEINPTLKKLKKTWQEKKMSIPKETLREKYQSLFEEFAQSPATRQMMEEIYDRSYWEEGEYLLTFIVITNEDNHFDEQRRFTLTAADIEQLHPNAPVIIADLCRQSNFAYQSVFSPLTPAV